MLCSIEPLPGRQTRPKEFSDHSTKPTTVCPCPGEPENDICPTSRLKFQTCLTLLKPADTSLSLSLERAPLPSLQMAPQPTPFVRRPNASILCLLPNFVARTANSLSPSDPIAHNCSSTQCLLHLRMWRTFWQPSTLILQLDRTASAHVT